MGPPMPGEPEGIPGRARPRIRGRSDSRRVILLPTEYPGERRRPADGGGGLHGHAGTRTAQARKGTCCSWPCSGRTGGSSGSCRWGWARCSPCSCWSSGPRIPGRSGGRVCSLTPNAPFPYACSATRDRGARPQKTASLFFVTARSLPYSAASPSGHPPSAGSPPPPPRPSVGAETAPGLPRRPAPAPAPGAGR